MTAGIPANPIPAINRIVRAAQTMFTETGRQPGPEELAVRLAMPLATVEQLLAIARQPIRL